MAKPTVIPTWATAPTLVSGPEIGDPPRLAADSGQQAQGFIGDQPVAARHVNWLLGLLCDWTGYRANSYTETRPAAGAFAVPTDCDWVRIQGAGGGGGGGGGQGGSDQGGGGGGSGYPFDLILRRDHCPDSLTIALGSAGVGGVVGGNGSAGGNTTVTGTGPDSDVYCFGAGGAPGVTAGDGGDGYSGGGGAGSDGGSGGANGASAAGGTGGDGFRQGTAPAVSLSGCPGGQITPTGTGDGGCGGGGAFPTPTNGGAANDASGTAGWQGGTGGQGVGAGGAGGGRGAVGTNGLPGEVLITTW